MQLTRATSGAEEPVHEFVLRVHIREGGLHYEPDLDALRAASTRIVVAAGRESEGEMTYRAALAVAERLGAEATIFPSHHGGFLGGEFRQQGEPGAFAAKAA